MRSRRLLLIVILILGVILLAVTAVLLLNQGDDPAPVADSLTVTPDIAVTLDPTRVVEDNIGALVEVVVSVQTVPRGWLMSAAELTTEKRLASEVGPNVIYNIDLAIGRYARTDIFQGETITTDALVLDPTLIGEQTYGPSSLIPFGFVAQSVPIDRLSSVAYALSPGDSVDIMFTFTFQSIDPELETLLPNDATFLSVTTDENGNTTINEVIISPYGRFEALATGAIAHIGPSEPPRPIPVSFVLQNARVIHVGAWSPPVPPPTPTPIPEEGAPTPTPIPPTPVPPNPNVILLAMPPQSQLLLKYALEQGADIDYALRRAGDAQPYTVENVSSTYLLNRFNVEIPPEFGFSLVGSQLIVITDGFVGDGTADGGE